MTISWGLAGVRGPGLGLARARWKKRSSLPDGCVAYWSLDELSGTRHDMTGGADAVEVGGTVSGMPGVIGNAAKFVGGASAPYLYQAWGANPLPGSFTVACWANVVYKASGSYGIVTRYTSVPGTRQFALYYSAGYQKFIWMVCDSSGNEWQTPGLNVTGSLHFVVGLYDVGLSANGSLAYYYDGVMTAWMAKVRPRANVVDGGGVYIGAAEFALARLDGLVDEVGIWNRVLTVDELDTLYNGGLGCTYPFS